MFYDREDAAKKLATALQAYKNERDILILAVPRGGVILGKAIAQELNLPLDIVVAKKIGAPENPEYAIGAVTEKGEPILNDEVIGTMGITADYLDKEITEKRQEIKRRLQLYRGESPAKEIKNKTIILVDDGIATGLSILASIEYIRSQGPKKIIVAVPVAPKDELAKLKKQADEFISLENASEFFAVGQFYQNFQQVSDQQVIAALNREV